MKNKKGNFGISPYDLVYIESGRQDSNLRHSVPKALIDFKKDIFFWKQKI